MSPPFLWKAELSCSESRIEQIAFELARALLNEDRVILEGPMGTGKSTFARALLRGLGIDQPAEGSPTFAIAHEYSAQSISIIHMDLYRLKSEADLEEAGIDSYLWDRECIVLVEWLSQFPEYEAAIMKPQPRLRLNPIDSQENIRVNWKVQLEFDPSDDQHRTITVSRN